MYCHKINGANNKVLIHQYLCTNFRAYFRSQNTQFGAILSKHVARLPLLLCVTNHELPAHGNDDFRTPIELCPTLLVDMVRGTPNFYSIHSMAQVLNRGPMGRVLGSVKVLYPFTPLLQELRDPPVECNITFGSMELILTFRGPRSKKG